MKKSKRTAQRKPGLSAKKYGGRRKEPSTPKSKMWANTAKVTRGSHREVMHITVDEANEAYTQRTSNMCTRDDYVTALSRADEMERFRLAQISYAKYVHGRYALSPADEVEMFELTQISYQ